ncbi:MAG TPA: DHHA1 domain-containing protein [Vicinamibacterales bacterium]|nr:DHHA1 domain-containing protein [Vicinamibacterales bacterium]
MTERIYYTDPTRTEFEAVVERVEPCESGLLVVLNRTAFYPTSGGQPHDTGRLGGAGVIDVVDREDGSVGHVIDGRLEAGQPVHGTIDWPRRFDHMQQHSGQHALSAAFDRLLRVRTVSFHLGRGISTIDLEREVSPAEIQAAEDEANAIVWRNEPVSIRFATPEEAAALPLRKEPVREGTLRLVAIGDVDLSACGGTHVERTGTIGLIAVRAWERFKGGTRIEFACGGRALDLCRTLRDQLAAATRLLSVSGAELPDAVERLQQESRELRRAAKGLQEQLAGYEAVRLAAGARVVGAHRLVVEAPEGWDATGLKALAQAIALQPGLAAVLFSRSVPALVVVARAKDATLDARQVLNALMARFGGKGGGRPDLAQGGGLNGSTQELVAAAVDAAQAAV